MSTPARKLEHGRVGESVRRADAVPKVAGEFAYASDLFAAGMLWGHTVRSPHAHALIRAIDTSKATGMPGVHAVLTHEDVPGEKRYGLEFRDQPVLAFERVRYFGEPVAVVAAESPEQARRAAELVRVEYEPLEPVTDAGDRHRERPDPPGAAGRGATASATTRGRTSSARSSSATATRTRPPTSPSRGPTSSASRTRRSSAPSRASPSPTAKAASTSTSPPSGSTSTATRSPRASGCSRSRCASTSAASEARSAAARTSPCRSTARCSPCTRTGR